LRGITRSRIAVAGTAAALMATVATGAVPAAQAATHVLLVCNGSAGCPQLPGATYYRSLQLAVNHAQNGDWVLVWPGRYPEATTVEQGHGLTGNLHIRGMNRNGVVLDGSKATGSGVHVLGVNNTWVENMTAMHYHTGSAN